MLARRNVLEMACEPQATGPFDEAFFMYSEELDLCRRVRTAGRRVVFVPQARVIHHEGRSSEQAVAARHIHFNSSKIRYYQKHHGVYQAEILRRYLLLEFRIQLWLERGKRLLGHRRDLRTSRIDTYRAVLASGLRQEN